MVWLYYQWIFYEKTITPDNISKYNSFRFVLLSLHKFNLRLKYSQKIATLFFCRIKSRGNMDELSSQHRVAPRSYRYGPQSRHSTIAYVGATDQLKYSQFRIPIQKDRSAACVTQSYGYLYAYVRLWAEISRKPDKRYSIPTIHSLEQTVCFLDDTFRKNAFNVI